MCTSSARGWKVPYEGGTIKSEQLTFPKSGSEGKYVLGLMLEGQFNNAFENEFLPDWPSKEENRQVAQPQEQKEPVKKEKAQMQAQKPGKIIIIGCAKMFNDDLMNGPGNLGLFSNIVDGLTLGDRIIKLRSNAYTSRDLKKLTDSQKILYRFLTIPLVPILLAIYAAARLILRRKEKQFYLKAIEK
jgi:ABC-type uncharacterized transport system involved in gliding motility auxiliary subunit